MKKIISFLLVFVLFFTQVPCTFAAEPFAQGEFLMTGNLIGTGVPTPCLNVDSIAYIPAEYAAMAGDCSYEMTDTGMNFYGRGFDFVTEIYHQDEQGVVWVPISSTLEQMEVLAFATPGELTTEGKRYMPGDVIDITDQAFNGKWRISALDGVGTGAIVCASVFNIATEWKLAEFFTGKYTKDQYREAFSLIMQKDENENDSQLLNIVKGTDEKLSILSKLEQASVGAKNTDDVMDAFRTAKLTDGETLLALYEDVSNPIKEIIDHADFDAPEAFDFLDIGTQLDIYEYLMSIMTASTYYVDMVDTVFFSDIIRDIDSGKWGSYKMITAAEELVDYFRSDSFKEIFETAMTEELLALYNSGINEALENATKYTSSLLAAYDILYGGITEFLTGASHSENIDDTETTYYLAEIQTTAKKLYWAYSSVEGAELEAKYAALLYLRCAEVWSYLFEEQVPEANFIGYREALNIITSDIMDIPDFDIIGVVQNEEIYYEDLIPPPPAAGKFSTVINIDGFEYQYDIQFNHDGTASIGGGIPFSEYDEMYNGTYTLLMDEEPNTYRFNVNGGFSYYEDEAPISSETQDYELVIQVTPIPDSEEYTVTILFESAPLFYTHDLPNFTFIPYE